MGSTQTEVMDSEYSLLTSEKKSSCCGNVGNPSCSNTNNGDEDQSFEGLSLISDDDDFSALSSDDVQELSSSEIGLEKEKNEEEICSNDSNDSPCYSLVSDESNFEESLSDHEVHEVQKVHEDQRSQTSLATNQRKRQHEASPQATKAHEGLSVQSSDSDSDVQNFKRANLVLI